LSLPSKPSWDPLLSAYTARQIAGMRVVSILSILLLAATPAVAEQAPTQVCFTPGGKCTDLIVSEIAGAQQSILVQAYSFTSVPILAALKAAHARGVDVEVIVDKTSARQSQIRLPLLSGNLFDECRHPGVGRYQGRHRAQPPPPGLSARTSLTRPLECLQGLLRDSYRGNCRVRVGGRLMSL
jgi:phosphatidylserine/phosphatidylglycerophosphate/cardiolipin synthase-like enzyme